MSSFKGQFHYSLDDKGRFNIPARLRRVLSPEANETFTVIRGFDSCLFIYPNDEWKKYEDKLRKLSTNKEKNRRFLRMVASFASEDKLDKQGRITIPSELMNFAKIKKDILILGVIDHIEVWDPEAYNKHLEASEDSFENLAEEIMFDD